jgi:hypothetical protein
MARELNTRERQLCLTIAEQKPSRRATQRHPASEPVILIWIPGRCPSSSTECPPPTHVDRGREVPDDREFPRGTFSQAELTDERVITRQHLTASASASDTLFNRLFERSNTSRSCHRPGAKMGSHPAKSRQESGGVWTVICPGKQHFANLLDSSRPARGLLHTEEVTGSIPVSPTRSEAM